MDLRRLRTGEWIAGISGAALLVVTFLEWYSAGGGIGATAWEAFSMTDLLVALAALLAVALAAATARSEAPAVPVALSVITATLTPIVMLIVVIRIIWVPGPNEVVDPSAGAFLGLLALAAVTAGAWIAMRDEERPAPPVPVDHRPAPPPGVEADPPPSASPGPPVEPA